MNLAVLTAENKGQKTRVNFGKVLRLVSTFITGQGTIQVLSVLTSLFLVRRMSIPAYAQYSLALGFQTTAISLTNLQLTETIIPLVGSEGSNHELVGSYVQAAKELRNGLFAIVAPCCAVLFWLTARKHNWDVASELMLVASILLSINFSASVSCYSAPLVLNRRLYDYYTCQAVPAAARLGAYVLAGITGVLSAGSASLVQAGSLLLGGALARHKSANLVELPTRAEKSTKKRMLRCMLPMIPSAIFVSFQPQLGLFLMSAFGQTLQIAEVAAVNKVGQLFLVFNTFNALVLEPYVARLPADKLASVLCRVIGGMIVFASLLSAPAFAFAPYVTGLLGPQYKGLNTAVFLVVLGASINIVSNSIWVMNHSPNFAALLTHLRSEYDMILIDTPLCCR